MGLADLEILFKINLLKKKLLLLLIFFLETFQSLQGYKIAVVDDGYAATSVELKYFKEKNKNKNLVSSGYLGIEYFGFELWMDAMIFHLCIELFGGLARCNAHFNPGSSVQVPLCTTAWL
jgi:hypothetical protein